MIGGISQRMLTLDAARAGARRPGDANRVSDIPPRVDYELTDLGRGLQGPRCVSSANGPRAIKTEIQDARTRFASAGRLESSLDHRHQSAALALQPSASSSSKSTVRTMAGDGTTQPIKSSIWTGSGRAG